MPGRGQQALQWPKPFAPCLAQLGGLLLIFRLVVCLLFTNSANNIFYFLFTQPIMTLLRVIAFTRFKHL